MKIKKNKKVGSPSLYPGKYTHNAPIPLELVELENNSFHLIVKVEIDNIRGDMIIDTGASVTVIDQKLFPPSDEETTEVKMQSGSVSGQINDVQLIQVSELKIGGRKFRNVQLAALNLEYVNEMYNKHLQRQIIGLLGCDFCVKYQVVIDYRNQKLFIHK